MEFIVTLKVKLHEHIFYCLFFVNKFAGLERKNPSSGGSGSGSGGSGGSGDAMLSYLSLLIKTFF